MGRRPAGPLAVSMNGVRAATLRPARGGGLELDYTPEWLADDGAMPLSLSLPLSPTTYRGQVLDNYLDNLLPEGRDLRERVASAVGAESPRAFDLLSAIGRDCVGAAQFHPPEETIDIRTFEAEPVTDAEIAATLRNLGSQPLGMDRGREFRVSIAGAQRKSALTYANGIWYRPRGATPTNRLLKLPIGELLYGPDLTDSVENEWLCLRILRVFGLPVAEAKIADFENVRALVVERFDRFWSSDGRWIVRRPQEDFCQALGLPPGRKYESEGGPGIAEGLGLLQGSDTPAVDRRVFFQAQVVFWLLAAIDGHGKNFSLFLEPGGRCRATPLYDVLSAWPLVRAGGLHQKELKMAMAVRGTSRHYRWDEIQRRHWASTAKAAEFSPAEAEEIVEETLARVPAVIQQVTAELPSDFPADVADSILEGLRTAAGRTAR